jgi:hypothetical protein
MIMKTTDLLTFFQPEESSGTASTFSIQASDGPEIEVWVFAREKVNLARFTNSTVSSEEERKNLHQEIHGALQAGGGLLVYARPHNEVVKVQVFRVEIPGYAPPKRMLRLGLSGDAQFETITGNADLEIGDHLLIPVSKDAEARLNALRDDLKGLPSDLESSVLNIIRRPSLEWRIERIERTLSMPAATQAERQRSRTRKMTFPARLYDLVMRPIPIGPAIATALLLMAGSLFAYDRLAARGGNLTPETPPAVETPHTKPTPSPKPPEDSQVTADDTKPALDALFAALEGSKNKALQTLYGSHFKGHQEDPFGDTSPVVWGIAKLEALRNRLITESDPLLAGADRQAGVKALYNNQMGKKALADTDSLNLLAWTSCRRFDKAALPETKSAPIGALSFDTGHTCEELKPEDALAGLKALTAWVNMKDKQTTTPGAAHDHS